jgi:hypothetical protein
LIRMRNRRLYSKPACGFGSRPFQLTNSTDDNYRHQTGPRVGCAGT